MEQIALFKPPYKYIIDTSAILNQKYTNIIIEMFIKAYGKELKI